MDRVIFEPFFDSKLLNAIRAIKGIKDSVIIVHGKSCCHSDNLVLSLMTSDQTDTRIVGSGIRLQDITTGGYRKLYLAIKSAYEQFHPSIIFVLVASFPYMMADDVEGIIDEIKKEIPVEIVSINCAGYMEDGYKEVLRCIEKYIEEKEKEPYCVNIIGIKEEEPHIESDIKELKRLIKSQGIKINSLLFFCTFSEINSLSKASLNIVLSKDGLLFADYMKKKFNTDYVFLSYPYGIKGTTEFLEKINNALKKETNYRIIEIEKEKIKTRLQKIYKYLQGIYGLKAAVVGDKEKAVSFSKFLLDELGFEISLLFIKGEKEKIDIDADEIIFSDDQQKLKEVLLKKKDEIAILFGSSVEKRICTEFEIPNLKLFFPVLDEVSISDCPYVGFKGVINLCEKIINTIIGA